MDPKSRQITWTQRPFKLLRNEKTSYLLHQTMDFGQKANITCDFEIFHLIKLPSRCQSEASVFHVHSKDIIKTPGPWYGRK